jgi:hypothetical protein
MILEKAISTYIYIYSTYKLYIYDEQATVRAMQRPNLFSFHLQTYAKCGLHLAQGPFDPHSVGHAHVHSWTSLQHIGSNFQINNIYIYICSTYRPRNYLRLFGCNDLWDYCNNHELITTHQENLG